jgi:hypothetical protein
VLNVGTKVRTIKLYERGGESVQTKTMFKPFTIMAKNIGEAIKKLEKELAGFFKVNGTEIVAPYKSIKEKTEKDEKDYRPDEFIRWAEEMTADI